MHFRLSKLAVATISVLACTTLLAKDETTLKQINITAEDQVKQALGFSLITNADILRRPVTNDLAQIIRTQPGINLTGNSTSGQRGNNRQIDIRGMGPDNSLILINGKPVNSRQSVRYGWRGERDTRGDTNWVPAEMVERIEVLRGPAAARYGNGAAGGVVNIITKQSTDKLSGSITTSHSIPQHSEEGSSSKTNFNLTGPISDNLGIAVYGNFNKTNPDAWNINQPHRTEPPPKQITNPKGETVPNGNANSFVAGREGVKNTDINAILNWQVNDSNQLELSLSKSIQNNLYAGDTQNNNGIYDDEGKNKGLAPFINTTTNKLNRNNFALTHTGDFGNFSSKSFIQYEQTNNKRIDEGLAGGTEGKFAFNKDGSVNRSTAKFKATTAQAEVYIPATTGEINHVFTLGFNFSRYSLDDKASTSQVNTDRQGPNAPLKEFNLPVPGKNRDSKISANLWSLYLEDNIDLQQGTVIVPSLRFDQHSISGSNISPGLNIWHTINKNLTVKAGVVNAYKAPNLYQLNPNYALYSRGQGCWGARESCYLLGNDKLKAENSINSEIGIEFTNEKIVGSLTYFYNYYRNKVEAGTSFDKTENDGNLIGVNIYKWDNIPKAEVSGLEGSFNYNITSNLAWNNNFTYMISSKNKANDEPLSIIPKFTVNSELAWQVTPQFNLGLAATIYGKQEPKKFDYNGNPVKAGATAVREAYAIASLNAGYKFNDHVRVNFGVSNLFDKRLFREGNAQGVAGIPGAGANTYNEPGRTFNFSLTAAF